MKSRDFCWPRWVLSGCSIWRCYSKEYRWWMGPGPAPVRGACWLPVPARSRNAAHALPPLVGLPQFGQLQPNPTPALEDEFPGSKALQNNPWLQNPWPKSNRQHKQAVGGCAVSGRPHEERPGGPGVPAVRCCAPRGPAGPCTLRPAVAQASATPRLCSVLPLRDVHGLLAA